MGELERWTEALRAGDHEHVATIRTGDGYCCLGVVTDVSGKLYGTYSPTTRVRIRVRLDRIRERVARWVCPWLMTASEWWDEQ